MNLKSGTISMLDYFPTKLAKGQAFCNRKVELKRLKYNIESIAPTLLYRLAVMEKQVSV